MQSKTITHKIDCYFLMMREKLLIFNCEIFNILVNYFNSLNNLIMRAILFKCNFVSIQDLIINNSRYYSNSIDDCMAFNDLKTIIIFDILHLGYYYKIYSAMPYFY